MHDQDCHDALDWTAFCYAAGELTPAEAEAFEMRLANDQAAGEALARAVELTQAVAAAETMEPVLVVHRERSTWGRRVAWMAIGSAASLMVAALVAGSGAGTRIVELLGGDANIATTESTGELATAWSETRQELSVASDAAGLWYPEHLDAVESEPDVMTDDREELAIAAAPAWLTAAVRGAAGLPVEGETREN
jgi:hypothetical protein